MNTALDLARPALVLVDLQNDNVHPTGRSLRRAHRLTHRHKG